MKFCIFVVDTDDSFPQVHRLDCKLKNKMKTYNFVFVFHFQIKRLIRLKMICSGTRSITVGCNVGHVLTFYVSTSIHVSNMDPQN